MKKLIIIAALFVFALALSGCIEAEEAPQGTAISDDIPDELYSAPDFTKSSGNQGASINPSEFQENKEKTSSVNDPEATEKAEPKEEDEQPEETDAEKKARIIREAEARNKKFLDLINADIKAAGDL